MTAHRGVVFADTADRADFIKSELETNALLRGRTHVILSTDTWLVLDTLATVVRVMPVLGGMISGRNDANPWPSTNRFAPRFRRRS